MDYINKQVFKCIIHLSFSNQLLREAARKSAANIIADEGRDVAAREAAVVHQRREKAVASVFLGKFLFALGARLKRGAVCSIGKRCLRGLSELLPPRAIILFFQIKIKSNLCTRIDMSFYLVPTHYNLQLTRNFLKIRAV